MSEELNNFPVKNVLGEGPRWHPGESKLYWVDIEASSIFTLDPGTGQIDTLRAGQRIGCLGFRRQGGLILAGERGFGKLSKLDAKIQKLLNPEEGKTGARFNDGRVGPRGSFWAGTMTETGSTSSLYRLDPDGNVQQVETRIGIANGIDWSPDCSLMYFTDSADEKIFTYDFDQDSGALHNRRVFVSTAGEPGVPDGLCVDSEGFVWSARWDGWKIVRYDPHGTKVDEINVPVQRPTCCCFGGEKLHTLYITSARIGIPPESLAEQPLAGALFWIDVEVKGRPETYFEG
jgi:sugar lactone lactonase YvrE